MPAGDQADIMSTRHQLTGQHVNVVFNATYKELGAEHQNMHRSISIETASVAGSAAFASGHGAQTMGYQSDNGASFQ